MFIRFLFFSFALVSSVNYAMDEDLLREAQALALKAGFKPQPTSGMSTRAAATSKKLTMARKNKTHLTCALTLKTKEVSKNVHEEFKEMHGTGQSKPNEEKVVASHCNNVPEIESQINN